MRALIVGLGSIGRRHLTNLRQIDPGAFIAVWRQRSKPEEGVGCPEHADRIVYCQEDAIATHPDVALITNPASLHIETGLVLAREGIHLFVEKPLSNTLDGVADLIAQCREGSLVLMVGYNLRFCLSLQVVRRAVLEGRIGRVAAIRAEVGQFLPDWRPGIDYRQGVSARRELGGGAVLELSHELDYVRWLVGEVSGVSAQVGQVSDLEMDVEDIAEITLKFHSGAIGSVHLDLLQRAPTRTCRIIGTEGTLTWDGLNHGVQLYSAFSDVWTDLHPVRSRGRDEMYLAELRHFCGCVEGQGAPPVDGDVARRVLEIALAAKRSSSEQRVVKL